MKKTICITLFVAVALASVTYFYKWYSGNRPCDQPYTTWMSEDKMIAFSIDENGVGTGRIQTGDKTIAIHVATGLGTQIELYPLECVTDAGVMATPIERWSGDFVRDDMFTATVKESTYYLVGDTITIYRVDDVSEMNAIP